MNIPILSQPDYEAQIASTRDARMAWWREARFGMFVHFGLYSILGRNEWAQARENIPKEEYAKLAEQFHPKPGCAREWAALAKKAGMKYMVLTARHHDGFSLWDSKANPFNSVNLGPHRDIVREYVDACREFGLKIGLYNSLMDWHHPDAWRCAFDQEARQRFLAYIEALNTELLTGYGKIDILWYDVPLPMTSWEGWDSLARNQRLRALQPDLIINNRSRLPEDFGTPEAQIKSENRDWEACMTFNDLSWGYVDEEQSAAYAYTAPRILKMLYMCSKECGNLLLNIGPKPDGSVPADAEAPLTGVGEWMQRNAPAVYGLHKRHTDHRYSYGNGVTSATLSADGKTFYLWNWIWPRGGEMGLGGYMSAPKRVYLLMNGQDLDFEFRGQRIILKNLPKEIPDPLGVTVICMEFEEAPQYRAVSYYPQWYAGQDIAGENKL